MVNANYRKFTINSWKFMFYVIVYSLNFNP